jgi:transposase
VLYEHWKKTTLFARGLVAPLMVGGAINGELLRRYVEQHLAPTLTADVVVVLDNLNAHNVARVREAIKAVARGSGICRYCPDFNPIEKVVAKFKWLVRSAAERIVEGLWRRAAANSSIASQNTSVATTSDTQDTGTFKMKLAQKSRGSRLECRSVIKRRSLTLACCCNS